MTKYLQQKVMMLLKDETNAELLIIYLCLLLTVLKTALEVQISSVSVMGIPWLTQLPLL